MEEKIEELRVLIDLLTKECEILRHELDIAKSHKDEVVKLLIQKTSTRTWSCRS